MPDLPQIWARPNLTPVQLPAVQSISRGFVTLADVAAGMAERQAVLDDARNTSMYDDAVNNLKNSFYGTDPNTWREQFLKAEPELRKQFGDSRILNLHADKRLGANLQEVTTGQIKASRDQGKADLDMLGADYARMIAQTDNPEEKKRYERQYHVAVDTHATPTLIGGRPAPANITQGERTNYIQSFDRAVQKNEAEVGLDRNASKLIRDLDTPQYNLLLPAEKREYKSLANTRIRQDIEVQEHELKVEQRKANNNIQQMYDENRPLPEIQAKLKEYTVADVMTREDRSAWDAKLKAGAITDTPEQVENEKRVAADYNANYMKPGNVGKFRDLVNKMRGDGRLGDTGATKLLNELNNDTTALTYLGYAGAAAGRAAANAGKVPFTAADVAKTIAQPFPQDAGRKPSKGHQEDINKFNNAVRDAAKQNKPINAAEVSEKIRDDRQRQIDIARARNKAVNELPAGEAAALKELNKMKSVR